ncbi:hypothetical protein MSIMFI_03395 [Mycobacterium simulans]|nr:hypothetical protein MSIMFI_03395 [Mycobacterium simulans]
MAVTTWLTDKSAYNPLSRIPDAQIWIDRIEVAWFASAPSDSQLPLRYPGSRSWL